MFGPKIANRLREAQISDYDRFTSLTVHLQGRADVYLHSGASSGHSKATFTLVLHNLKRAQTSSQ